MKLSKKVAPSYACASVRFMATAGLALRSAASATTNVLNPSMLFIDAEAVMSWEDEA